MLSTCSSFGVWLAVGATAASPADDAPNPKSKWVLQQGEMRDSTPKSILLCWACWSKDHGSSSFPLHFPHPTTKRFHSKLHAVPSALVTWLFFIFFVLLGYKYHCVNWMWFDFNFLIPEVWISGTFIMCNSINSADTSKNTLRITPSFWIKIAFRIVC